MAVGGYWRFVIVQATWVSACCRLAQPVGDCGEVGYGTLGAWTSGQHERDASERVPLLVPLPLALTGVTAQGRSRQGNG